MYLLCLQTASTNRAKALLYIKTETTSKSDRNIYCYCTIFTTHRYILIHSVVNCCSFYACQIDNYCKVRPCYTTNDQNWFGQKSKPRVFFEKRTEKRQTNLFLLMKNNLKQREIPVKSITTIMSYSKNMTHCLWSNLKRHLILCYIALLRLYSGYRVINYAILS